MKVTLKNNKSFLEFGEKEVSEIARNLSSNQPIQTKIPDQISIFIEDEIKFETYENLPIPEDSIVTVKEASEGIIVRHSFRGHASIEDYTKRINKDEYVVWDTGEIRRYKKSEYKNKENIQRSMSRLKDTILLNFSENTKCIFVSLSLNAEHATDSLEKFNKLVSNFFRRLKYNYEDEYCFAYVARFEQQMNLNWHAHCLIKDTRNKKIFLDKQDLDKIWQNGYTYVNRVQRYKRKPSSTKASKASRKITSSIINVADYLTKNTQIFSKIPSNSRLYITSNNLETPKPVKMKMKDVNEKKATLISENTYAIYKGDSLLNINKKMLYRK